MLGCFFLTYGFFMYRVGIVCACLLPLIRGTYEETVSIYIALDLIPDKVVIKILLGSVVTETELGGLTTLCLKKTCKL